VYWACRGLAKLLTKAFGGPGRLRCERRGQRSGLDTAAIHAVNDQRQYNYIHQLEEQLSKEYERKTFTREGDSYLKYHPSGRPPARFHSQHLNVGLTFFTVRPLERS
jgi:hypothetical protein